jgi:hypothetical protein
MTAHEKMISGIRSTTLAKAGLTPFVRNRIVAFLIMAAGDTAIRDRHILAMNSREMTIGNFIDWYEAMLKVSGFRQHPALNKLLERLVTLGMNHLDWHILPPETAANKIGALRKEQLATLDVRVLQAFFHKALRRIAHHILGQPWCNEPKLPRITIAELINEITFSKIYNLRFGSFDISFMRVKNMLETLGFGYEDGPFFQEGTSRKMAEDLATKQKISFRRARDIIKIAREEGWIKPPLG